MDDDETEYDECGFVMTDRLVKAYKEYDGNDQFIKEHWPHSSVDPVTPILRFTTVDNLQKMLRSRTNYLAPVLSWKDVYEGLTRKVTFLDQNKNKIDVSQIMTSFYGQCWTLSKYDSELLWNARCSEKAQNGACIQTTFGKLVSNFIHGIGMIAFNGGSIFARADRVQYLNKVAFEQKLNTLFTSINNSSGLSLASPELLDHLMVKRESFSDEQEVRLIVDSSVIKGPSSDFFDPQKFSLGVSGITYSVCPRDFLDEIILDPRIEWRKMIALKAMLEDDINHYGWRSNGCPLKVRQSDLYDKPERTVMINI